MHPKIYCLQSHPIQYFAPLFKEIESKAFCDFKVYYCSDSSIKGYKDKGFGSNVKWDIPLLDGYQYEFLKNYSPWPGTSLKFYNLINLGIVKAIRKEKPDIVWIYGWTYFTIWLAIITCKLTSTKIWMKCENPLNQELKKPKIKKLVKKLLLQYFLFKLINKFLYIGQENKEFYKHYGVPENKLIFSPYSVDNERFSKTFTELKDRKELLKKELQIPENKIIILYSGKLIPKKRPLDLLEAFLNLNDPNTFLIFLGNGELRPEIEERIAKAGTKNILITGFVNQYEIAKYYVISDIFVLPSGIGETWGLVVNEAMNFGLPIIVSDIVGCTKDLIKENINGFVFPIGNIEILKSKLKELIASQKKRKIFGKASIAHINTYSYKLVIKEIENVLTTMFQ